MNKTLSNVCISNEFILDSNGRHDTFVIEGPEVYDKIDLTIFNRSGSEVYRDTDYRNDLEVSDFNEGMYYYFIVLNKGIKDNVFKGWVLLGSRLAYC